MSSRRPSRHQLRRRARQAHRDGYQPMLMINSDDFPEPAIATIAHWIWRYRSEFTPITVAIVTALAAILLHYTHPRTWPWPAFATASAEAILVAPLPAWARKAWTILGVSVDDAEDLDHAPEIALWAALVTAPIDGATVPELMAETGMSRPWVYLRLRELADRGQVIQVSRGRWRAATSDDAE